MAFSLISHTYVQVGGGGGGTTSAIDTTGADLLVVFVGAYTLTAAAVTDSKSNTWSSTTMYNGSGASNAVQFFYATNVSGKVGSSHTFTLSGNTYSTMIVAAFSGAHTTAPFDKVSAGGNGATPLTGGSVTATNSNSLYIAGGSPADGSSSAATTSASGFTVVDAVAYLGGTAEGASMYWKEGSAAENPSFSWTGTSSPGTAQTAIFIPGAAPPPPTTRGNFGLLGVA